MDRSPSESKEPRQDARQSGECGGEGCCGELQGARRRPSGLLSRLRLGAVSKLYRYPPLTPSARLLHSAPDVGAPVAKKSTSRPRSRVLLRTYRLSPLDVFTGAAP